MKKPSAPKASAEKADVELEKRHLAADPEFELEELTQIYQQRGLDRSLAERLLGTVATEVVKRANCDVLIVRPMEPGEIPVPEDTPA